MGQQIEPLFVRFDRYALDEANARLTLEERPLALPPKAFAVLCALARQPGQLVTKNALLDAVWGHQHVSESVLKTTISELRAALSDDAKQPRYIETASRRGYRFIGVAAPAAAPAGPARMRVPAAETEQTPRMIGREKALAKLRAAWQQVQAGRRQLIWIAGEPGVGKTTLIESFLRELEPHQWVQGHCIEQFGAGEPYLPVLEAITDLCRRDPALVGKLRSSAPTWLLQMPWLCSEADRAALRQELATANQERMVREARELFDSYSMNHPTVFVIEDLHWTDDATLRLMDHFARRKNPACILWLGSFRLTEVMASEDHPLKALRHELRLHHLAEEIVLDTFSEQEVGDYLDDRFPDLHADEAFVRSIHDRTDGLPLFLVNVIEDLLSQGVLQPGSDTLPDAAAIGALQVPENLAGVIEKQIARLPAEARRVLEAASVCGQEFRAQVVADALELEVSAVTERCDRLARHQQWLQSLGIERLADGSLDARYGFRHALYRHVFYQRISALTRAQLHRRVAQSLQRGRDAGILVKPAELASHFELAHDPMSALPQYIAAFDSAIGHFAPREALGLTAQALRLLPACPEGAPRLQLELALMLRRGMAATQLFGISAEEVGSAYERAQALCDLLPESSALGWALNGLSLFRYGRGEYGVGRALATRTHALAERLDEPALRMGACNLIGMSCAAQGELIAAKDWLEQGIALCEQLGARAAQMQFVDPIVTMRGHHALHLLALGYPDQAREQSRIALERGRALGHAMAEGLATRCAGLLAVDLQEPERVASLAASLKVIASTHSIVQADAASRMLGGWAQAQLGDPEAGLASILESRVIYHRLGIVNSDVIIHRYAADALILAGRWADAHREIDEALALIGRIGERFYLPHMFLLQARVTRGLDDEEAERESLLKALSEARSQNALWLELTALMMLCELKHATEKDRATLKGTYAKLSKWLFDTSLIKHVQALLADKKGCRYQSDGVTPNSSFLPADK